MIRFTHERFCAKPPDFVCFVFGFVFVLLKSIRRKCNIPLDIVHKLLNSRNHEKFTQTHMHTHSANPARDVIFTIVRRASGKKRTTFFGSLQCKWSLIFVLLDLFIIIFSRVASTRFEYCCSFCVCVVVVF